MTIYIDASRAIRPNPTGVETYSRSIIENLVGLPTASQHNWILLYPETTAGPTFFVQDRDNVRWQGIPGRRFWTLARLTQYFADKQGEDACLFVPGHVLPYFTPARSVITIHDLAFRYFPQLYGLSGSLTIDRELRRSARKATGIIVPSISAAKDVKKFYNIHDSKIKVIPHGIQHEIYSEFRTEQRKPYVIFIGRLEGRKNIQRIVDSFLRFSKIDARGFNLYLVGKASPEWDRFWKKRAHEPFADRVHALGYISERDKLKLLAEASALFFPSLYEGFGIPILEAMTLGVPVITSTTSSLSEVGQNAAIYVDPLNIDEMVQSLSIIAGDMSQTRQLSQRGQKIAQEYTWEKAAQATFDCLTTS